MAHILRVDKLEAAQNLGHGLRQCRIIKPTSLLRQRGVVEQSVYLTPFQKAASFTAIRSSKPCVYAIGRRNQTS